MKKICLMTALVALSTVVLYCKADIVVIDSNRQAKVENRFNSVFNNSNANPSYTNIFNEKQIKIGNSMNMSNLNSYDKVIKLSDAGANHDSYAKVLKNNKWGIYDLTHQELCSNIIYDDVKFIKTYSDFIVTYNGKQIFKTIGYGAFEYVLPDTYDEVSLFTFSYPQIYKLCKNNKCTLAQLVPNTRLNILSDLIYDDFQFINEKEKDGRDYQKTDEHFYIAIRDGKKTLFPISNKDKINIANISNKNYDNFKAICEYENHVLSNSYRKHTIYGIKNETWTPLYTYKVKLQNNNPWL